MSSEQRPELARRVVTGVTATGRSIIISDAKTPTWVQRPTGSLIQEIWRVESLPADMNEEPWEDENGTATIAAPTNGVSVRIAVFPPDADGGESNTAAYEAAIEQLYGDQGPPAPTAIAGMHRTDTIDVVTVLDGEITVLMEDGETTLRAGDSLVQRGTQHAWRNRSDRPCTLVTTMVVARRD